MKINNHPEQYYYAEFTDGTNFTLVLKNDFEQEFKQHKEAGHTPIKKEQITHVFESQDANTSILHIIDLIREKTSFHLEMIKEDIEKTFNGIQN